MSFHKYAPYKNAIVTRIREAQQAIRRVKKETTTQVDEINHPNVDLEPKDLHVVVNRKCDDLLNQLGLLMVEVEETWHDE